MYKLSIKSNNGIEFSPLETLLNFVKLDEFAYGVPDVVRSPPLDDSISSIQSAYEVQERLNKSILNDTVLEDSSAYSTPKSLRTESSASSNDANSSTSGSFSISPSENQKQLFPPSENQKLLSELFRRVSSPSNVGIASTSLGNLNSTKAVDDTFVRNTSVKSKRTVDDRKPIVGVPVTVPDIKNVTKTASFDDHKIAQVVHDLVFEKYEESYRRLLNKLKKLHLTEEENRFRNVVVELESVLQKKTTNRQEILTNDVSISDTLETCSVISKPSGNGAITKKFHHGEFYSSTDSELEQLEVKPIGIPQSGKLDVSFTKTTCSNVVSTEPVSKEDNDAHLTNPTINDLKLSPKHRNSRDCIKNLHNNLANPNIIQNSKLCPVFNVQAQVYAFSVEGKHQKQTCDNENATTAPDSRHHQPLDKRQSCNRSLALQDAITAVDEIEEITDNSLYPSSSPLIRTATNRSYSPEYNEYKFLRAALGDELLEEASSNEYSFPHTVSITTDDISELLSSTSSIAQNRRRRCRNRRSSETISTFEKSVSLCNTVRQRPTVRYTNTSTVDGSESYASYETITNFDQSVSPNQDKKLIKNKIFVHETIIDQAERALEFGRRKARGFLGSPAHLEAERTLLVSKIRRQALINTLYTIQDAPSETLGRITIENLRCTLNTIRNNQPLSEQYYVCILQHKTTVYSSKIAAPNRLGWIEFGGCFVFDNITNTFNIKIELYGIHLFQTPQNCFMLPFLRTASKLPMIKLIGETHIAIMNRKNEKFSLIYRDGERFGEHKLSASIQTSIKWPETLRGFLTIGIEKQEHQPIWNRRWCVLESGQLKYYNYPSDENYCKPVGILDLDTCKCCDDTYRRYLRQKALALFIDGSSEFKIYYLSPDSTEEFNLWRKHVEVVLRLIKEWNMF